MTYRDLLTELKELSMDQLSVQVMIFDGANFVQCDEIVLPDDLAAGEVDLSYLEDVPDTISNYCSYPILLQV